MSGTATGLWGYSHDEAVAAITSYYKLLARAHAISGSYGLDLLHPPPGGWPQLSGDAAPRLGKSAAVMALMRHIPYFEVPNVIHIAPGVASLSYIAPSNLAPQVPSAPEPPAGGEEETTSLAHHLVFLGEPPDLMEFGSDLCVDTQASTAVLGNFHGETHPELFCDEDGWNAAAAAAREGEGEGPERGHYDGLFAEHGRPGAAWCWRVGTFFSACERNLRELHWLPGMEEDQRGHLHGAGEDDGRFALGREERRRIMRAHGWPGPGWDPRAARREVSRLLGYSDDEAGEESDADGEEEQGAKGQELPLRPTDGPLENPPS